MPVPRILQVNETLVGTSPAGQVLAGEVIACFLQRLSRHRRVMRMARRISLKRERDCT